MAAVLRFFYPKKAALNCQSGFFRNFYKTPIFSMDVIDFPSLQEKLSKKEIVLVDVREPSELTNDGKIPTSINIPLGQIADAFNMPDDTFQKKFGFQGKSDTIVLTCRSGKRATDAFQKLEALGYKNTLVYKGSFLDWEKNGGEILK